MEKIDLIQSARRGDLEAFNCLVLASQDTIFQHAIWMLGESEAAEDVTQATFLLAYHNFHSFQDEDLYCWLLRIANRLCLKELRWRERAKTFAHSALSNGSGGIKSANHVAGFIDDSRGSLAHKDLKKIVLESLMELSPFLRAVLTLGDIQGMNYHQTSIILGTSEGSVKSHLARARLRMSELIFAKASQEE